MTARAGAALVAAALAVLAAAPAQAFRTASDSAANRANGIAGLVAWRRRPVPFALHEQGSADVPVEMLEAAVVRAFRTWTRPSCSGLLVRYDGRTTTSAADSDDGEYVVQWRESGWAALGFSSLAIGVTNTSFTGRDADWALSSADTLLNGEDYTWVIEGGVAGTRTVDVESIVAHESGHFLGLLHPCEFGGLDGAPSCPSGTAPDPPTMFPRYQGQSQRTLADDDVAGICTLYPRAADDCRSAGCPAGRVCNADEATCVPDPSMPGGCACRATAQGAARRGASPLRWLLAAALAASRRRRADSVRVARAG